MVSEKACSPCYLEVLLLLPFSCWTSCWPFAGADGVGRRRAASQHEFASMDCALRPASLHTHCLVRALDAVVHVAVHVVVDFATVVVVRLGLAGAL